MSVPAGFEKSQINLLHSSSSSHTYESISPNVWEYAWSANGLTRYAPPLQYRKLMLVLLKTKGNKEQGWYKPYPSSSRISPGDLVNGWIKKKKKKKQEEGNTREKRWGAGGGGRKKKDEKKRIDMKRRSWGRRKTEQKNWSKNWKLGKRWRRKFLSPKVLIYL